MELTAEVESLKGFKVVAETLQAEKEAATLASQQNELRQFAQLHNLDEKDEAIASAIKDVNYAALVAEVTKCADGGKGAKLAPYAMAQAIKTESMYGGLLDRAE